VLQQRPWLLCGALQLPATSPPVVPSCLVYTTITDLKAPCFILIIPAPLDPKAAACCHSNPSLFFLSTIIQ
jgi:hypothetical protein